MQLHEIRNARIYNVTDPHGRSDPLWGNPSNDLSGVYVDANGTIYVNSQAGGLMAKGAYEKQYGVRFSVSGTYGDAAASDGAAPLQQATANNTDIPSNPFIPAAKVIPSDQFSAAKQGAGAIKAFAAAGGIFTNDQDEHGNTAAHYVTHHWAAAIKPFVAAGGTFTDLQNENGLTVAHLVANHGSAAIKAFAEVGGKFNELQDERGLTAAHYAVIYCGPDSAETVKAFAAAGGTLTTPRDIFGKTAADYAANHRRGNGVTQAFMAALAAQRKPRVLEQAEALTTVGRPVPQAQRHRADPADCGTSDERS
jgi:hypothetical protein